MSNQASSNTANGFPLMGETSKQLSPVGLPWIGGKKEKFKVYSSFFPGNIQTLVDPFAGGGTITFSTPADTIISNDFDRNIINLYKVIQENENWETILNYERGKENFKKAHKALRNSCIYLTELTRAKYMVADCFMSYSCARRSFVQSDETLEQYRQSLEKCLYPMRKAATEKKIEFICGDALELVEKYKEMENVFCFADPPYMNDTIKDNVYYKGMLSNNQHERLAKSLSQYKGPVMLCGYRGKFSYLYDRHLANAGFHCYKIMDTHAHSVQTAPGGAKAQAHRVCLDELHIAWAEGGGY